MKKWLLLLLLLATPCWAQDLAKTPIVKPPSIDIRRYTSAVREEQSKTPLTVVKIGENYESIGGIYKSISKSSLKEEFPFGFEYDGKYFFLEPLGVAWDTYEAVVDLTAYKADVSKTSVATKTANTLTYPAIGGITYSILAETDRWRKIVTIDPKQLIVPKGAKYLILSFKVDTDFVLPKGRTDQRFEVAEDCWLEVAKVNLTGSTKQVSIEHEFNGDVYYKYVPVSMLQSTVDTDVDITFGSATVFNNASTGEMDVAFLDATHFVIAYSDFGNAYAGTCIVGTVDSAGSITYGSEYVFFGGDGTNVVRYPKIAAFTSEYFMVVYRADEGETKYGRAICGKVANTNQITYGSAVTYHNGDPYAPILCRDADTKMSVVYYDISGAYKNSYRYVTRSTLTLSVSGTSDVATDGSYAYAMEKVGNYIVVVYKDGPTGEFRCKTALAGTLYATATVVTATPTYNLSGICPLSDTTFLVSGAKSSTYKGYCVPGALTGNTPSFGEASIFSLSINYGWNYTSLSYTGNSEALLSYRDIIGSIDRIYCKSVALAGATISYGSAYAISSNSSTYMSNSASPVSRIGVSVFQGVNTGTSKAAIFPLSIVNRVYSPLLRLMQELNQ